MGLHLAIDPLVADVFITGQLARRVPKTADYLREKAALQDLASLMADAPAQVLPRFVDLAMELTGGVSAGLSLYEENPAPGVFRWRYLRGILAPFEGATTPRNFSPCGITLDADAPVLSSHPEKVYNWIADANIVVPEVLLVPLHIGSKVPLGTLWVVSDKEGHFDTEHARIATELAAFVSIALQTQRTEQKLQLALEYQATLTREMDHRVKNLFAITDGMIRVSARAASTPAEMATLLSGRLHALSTAHRLVRRSVEDETQSPGSDLDQLLRMIVKPHEGPSVGNERIEITGPEIKLGNRAASGIAMVFHELATNAAKYGALTEDKGNVSISWTREMGNLIIRWQESGGPIVGSAPSKRGFGTTLAQNTIGGQFGGLLDYNWLPSGLSVEISVPLQNLAL